MADTTVTEETTQVRAQARYVRGSARKARVVLEHIRGKSLPQARAALAFTPRAAARDILSTLDSAAANAENNHDLQPAELRILEAYADEGPTLKRWQPRARGRAMRIRKRTHHLTLVLAHDPKLAAAEAASGTRRGAAAQAAAEARARRTGKAAPADATETTDAVAAEAAPKKPAARKRKPKAAATPAAEQAPEAEAAPAEEAPAAEAEETEKTDETEGEA
jgi:large subunit ribosomal protein L22